MEKIDFLLDFLSNEYSGELPVVTTFDEKFNLYRSLANIRRPKALSKEYLAVEDEFLKEINNKITDLAELEEICENIYLWQGDITTLKCDAIVNAANSALLGCFIPCHRCIDNAIHTFSGTRLRLECDEIMQKQGKEEPTGSAKITKAYNLPSKYVIHTVGPIVYDTLTESLCKDLENSYISCLKIAEENQVKSIAFCCISTGEFRFPNEEAAEIAIQTVEKYLKTTKSDIKVIFNVFKQLDFEIYKRLLSTN